METNDHRQRVRIQCVLERWPKPRLLSGVLLESTATAAYLAKGDEELWDPNARAVMRANQSGWCQ